MVPYLRLFWPTWACQLFPLPAVRMRVLFAAITLLDGALRQFKPSGKSIHTTGEPLEATFSRPTVKWFTGKAGREAPKRECQHILKNFPSIKRLTSVIITAAITYPYYSSSFRTNAVRSKQCFRIHQQQRRERAFLHDANFRFTACFLIAVPLIHCIASCQRYATIPILAIHFHPSFLSILH